MRRVALGGAAAMVAAIAVGCSGGNGGDEIDVPETYEFESRFVPGTSSVVYTGQIFRHVLIAEIKAYVGGLTARIDSAAIVPTNGMIAADLQAFYAYDGTLADRALTLLPGTAMQATLGAFGSTANLKAKIAGNDDADRQHEDWSDPASFIGMTVGTANGFTPEGLVLAWFEQLDELAVDRANGIRPNDPFGTPMTKVFVTEEGHDLQNLIQKFLDGAVAFSQGSDDYLDDDAGSGLNSDNVAQDGTYPYTVLEHGWDEGYGYFGAQRDYLDHTDAELAARPYFDANGDGQIDLRSEYSFGWSQNAVKRDAASVVPTDFSGEAMTGFLAGRARIAVAAGALDAHHMEHLREDRDAAIAAWERAAAATVVHYVNQVLVDMSKFPPATGYSFYDHAKHWSEMKGFALALQFNPRAPLTDEQLVELHGLLGDAPILHTDTGAIDAYKQSLRDARAMIGAAYGFDAANLGDANGLGGW